MEGGSHGHTPAARTPAGRRPGRLSLEVADIVRACGDAFRRTHPLTADQHDVLRDIARCRTAELGGHADVCTDCGHRDLSYNSCRNRHCPKCQGLAQARWVEQRMERMLPTHAFHVVFTLPRELRPLALANRELVFNALFASAAESLLTLGRDRRWLGADLGVTSVLHTWRRDLLFHPHVHCIVTGGGLSLDGTRWIEARPHFLFPVRVLGALFRGKMLDALRRAHRRGQLRLDGPAAPLADPGRFRRLCDRLQRTRWVVYCKPPFGSPEHVYRYLGRYTHRTGLSNHRLVSFDQRGVTFRTRGDGAVTVAPDEFLRRFLLHVLPRGFVKIRHHGLFAPAHVRTKLAAARALLTGHSPSPAAPTPSAPRDFREILLALTGLDLRRCRVCGSTSVVRCPLPLAAPPSAPAGAAPANP